MNNTMCRCLAAACHVANYKRQLHQENVFVVSKVLLAFAEYSKNTIYNILNSVAFYMITLTVGSLQTFLLNLDLKISLDKILVRYFDNIQNKFVGKFSHLLNHRIILS